MARGNQKCILCSQVEKYEHVTHTLSDLMKNLEDRIDKVRNQPVAMNRSNSGYISIVGSVARQILDNNVIPIPLLL
jgi:hypothetical protein